MLRIARGTFGVAQRARTLTTSSVARASSPSVVNPGYKTLKPTKEHFNMDDGTFIFKKGGVLDNIIYKVTMGACVGAILWNVKLYMELGLK